MTKKVADLCVKTGSYESQGKQKNRYQNVGAVLQTDDGGKFILLERTFNPAGVANPDGKETVLISMFDVKDGGETHKGLDKQGDIPPANPVTDDQIPF